MHLKWLLLMVLVLTLANEIKGWGSRRRSFGLSRRPFFSSRRRFISSRRRYVSSRRRFIFSRRRFISSRRRFISSRRRFIFSRRRFISSRRQFIFGRRRFISRRRRFISRRRRFVTSRRRVIFGRRRVISRRRRVISRRRRFISRRRRFISSRRRIIFGRRRFFSRRRLLGSRRGWWSKSKKVTFPHSIKTKSALTKLYNSKVAKVQRVSRPLQGFLGKVGITHSGVIVTLANGKKWLIHKGNGFGKSSQTVVVDPKYMSNKWTRGKTHRVTKTTVSEFVKAGGKKYNMFVNNYHHATARMCKIKG